MLSGPSSYPKHVSKESPSWIRSLNVWSTMRNLQRSTLSIFTGHLCQMTPTINRLFALYLLRIIFSASWDYHLLSFKLTTQGAVGFHLVNSPHSTTEELSILKTESKKPHGLQSEYVMCSKHLLLTTPEFLQELFSTGVPKRDTVLQIWPHNCIKWIMSVKLILANEGHLSYTMSILITMLLILNICFYRHTGSKQAKSLVLCTA